MRPFPITIPNSFPSGIDLNSTEAGSAHYIQNMLLGDNKKGINRYGTNLKYKHLFDESREFRENLLIMKFLKSDGRAEILTYNRYLSKLWYVPQELITLASTSDEKGSIITISFNTLSEHQQKSLRKILQPEVLLYVTQEQPLIAEISTVVFKDTTVEITVPILKEDYIEGQFLLYVERAAIYRAIPETGNFERLLDDLEPNVLPGYLNFDGKLLIWNGKESVKVYDGNKIDPLKSPVGINVVEGRPITVRNDDTTGLSTINVITSEITSIMVKVYVKSGAELSLIQDNDNVRVNVKSVTFTKIDPLPPTDTTPAFEGGVQFHIVVDKLINLPIKSIDINFDCPNFSYMAVCHNRLWGLAPGGQELNSFRSPGEAMMKYFAQVQERYNKWINEKTYHLDYINATAYLPEGSFDDAVALYQFNDKVLLMGKNNIQVWVGTDPTTKDDGTEVNYDDYKWYQTLPYGLIQCNLFIELPNYLLIWSDLGIIPLWYDKEGKLQIDLNFSAPIYQYLMKERLAIQNNRQYREMSAFIYPYGKFIGFRINYSCFIMQLNPSGGWVFFGEVFAESPSFCYYNTTRELLLSGMKGEVIMYADKQPNLSYEDYGKGKIPWKLEYNWAEMEDLWYNEFIDITVETKKPETVEMRFYLDKVDVTSIQEIIRIEREGAEFELDKYGEKYYAYYKSIFAYEFIPFLCQSLKISLFGLTNEKFIFDKINLNGGTQRG